MKKLSISALLLASSLVTGLNLNVSSAVAANLGCLVPTGFAGDFFGNNPGTGLGNYLFDQGNNKETFETNCGVTDIGIVEGRAGASGIAGDYEVGIGLNGAQADLADQLQLAWVDDEVNIYNWTLSWNPTSNIASFNVEGNTIDYDFDLSASPTLNLDKLNAFGIQARADDPSSFISQDTSMTITVDSITIDPLNGNSSVTQDPGISIQAISDFSAENIVHNFYTINAGAGDLNSANSEITSMSGTFALDIPEGGVNPQDQSARSRIGFQILLFDPPVGEQPVPESMSVLSLLGIGTLSLGTLKKKAKKQSLSV